jgi:diguanylate cyclase (GGDEF)-like protein/PAS domain S-box-containing protein
MDKRIRIIVIDDDFNDSEKLISIAKSTGYAVRPEKAEDEEDLIKLLDTHDPDMIMCTIGIADLSLEQTIKCVQNTGRVVPVIAIDNDETMDTAECMAIGASDRVVKSAEAHIKQVIIRTAETHYYYRQMREASEAQEESDELRKTLLNSSKDAITYVTDGMHIYANDQYLQLFGYESWDDLEGMPIMDLIESSQQQAFKDFLKSYGKSDNPNQEFETKLQPMEDEAFEAKLEFSATVMDGEHCTQIVIRGEAENSQELQDQLEYLSKRDLLTGLYNRPTFMEQLNEAISKAQSGKGQSTLLEFEIDKYDELRAEHGISAGDALLAELGKLLNETFGDEQLVARFDDDTFTMIAGTRDEKALNDLSSRLLDCVSSHTFTLDGKSVKCSLAIGAAMIDEDAPDENELLSRANKAFVEAAEADGNRMVLYKPKAGEMSQKQVDTEWAQRIKEALTSDRLKLLFQPIVSLHGGPGQRYEVFVRMLDEDGTEISPAEFIESAERSGMAKALDRWIALNAIKKLQEHRQSGNQAIFFIKLTAGSLQDEGIPAWIQEQIKSHNVPPECFVFELKEKTALSYLPQTKALITALHEIECEFTLDGFGAGADPFQILSHINADYLKIDAEFMKNLAGSPENQRTIKEITDQAHSKDKLTISQCVDDANALSVLWGIGVNYIQGNFLAQPSEALDYDFSAMGG